MKDKIRLALLACLVCILGSTVNAGIIYVDKDASGAEDGSSWTDAYIDLQDAIDSSVDGDRIWVAANTYFPTRDRFGNTSPSDPREVLFKLKDGVKIYGGFTGTESMLGERDWALNPTILSGDIGSVGDSTDNCYIVVWGNNLNEGTLFDGFRIRAANAVGSYFNPFSFTYSEVGAMRIEDSRLIIRNTRFTQNTDGEGAGLHSVSSQLRIVRCAFVNNSGTSIYRSSNISTDTICNSVFASNDGPALEADDTYIFNCTFYNNLIGILIRGTTSIYNTIIAESVIQSVRDDGGFGPAYDVQNCILDDGVQNLRAYQNIQVTDPRLADPEALDFTPLSCSPAVNEGESTWAVFPFLPDFLDQPRNAGASIDIGAIEFQGTPTSVNEVIIYVDESATGAEDGTSWADAYTSLADAVAEGNQMGGCDRAQIRVAEGQYYASDANDATDLLIFEKEMEVYGGFPAGGGPQGSRDWVNQKSIISGDIGVPGDPSDNSDQLLEFRALDSNSVFNGFHLEGVYLDDEESAVVFDDCFFFRFKNVASVQAYGEVDGYTTLFDTRESTLQFDQVEVSGANVRYVINSPYVFTNVDVEPGIHKLIFNECLLDSNTCEKLIYARDEFIELDGCTFTGNQGDLVLLQSFDAERRLSLDGCSFYDNTCETCFSAEEIHISSSLIANQIATTPSEVLLEASELVTIQGSTIFDHSDVLIQEVSFGNADVVLQNSILSGLYGLEFDGFNPDFDFTFENSLTRTTYAGQVAWIEGPARYADIEARDFTLRNCSPGKNAGDPGLYTVPAEDLNGDPRIVGILDIGAIENQTLFAAPLTETHIYVDSSALGNGSGTTWANANPNLAQAILSIALGDQCFEVDSVSVAQGTYLPSISGSAVPIVLVDDLVLMGGYPSGGGMRDADQYPTVISGDIGILGDPSDNASTLMRISNQSVNSVIDGIQFTKAQFGASDVVVEVAESQSRFVNCKWFDNGFAPDYIDLVSIQGKSPAFRNCAFKNNRTIYGVYNDYLASDTMVFRSCTFVQNQSPLNSCIFASAPLVLKGCDFIQNISGSAGTITHGTSGLISDCKFISNEATTAPIGIVSSAQGELLVEHSVFVGNSTFGNGGAIHYADGDLTIRNCLFAQNSAAGGGAIYLLDASPIVATTATIINSTFDQNIAGSGQSIFSEDAWLDIYNSILWGNGQTISWSGSTVLDFDYNVYSASGLPPVSGVIGPNNLFGVDPLFLSPLDPDGPDDIFGTIDDGLQVQKSSPVKDAGDNSYVNMVIDEDLAGRTRKYFDHVDIGAYELICGDTLLNLYFSLDAAGPGNGTSWQSAAQDIGLKLSEFVMEGCMIDSIKLAEGVYPSSPEGDRYATITLPSGSTLAGGFNVINGVEVDRDPDLYPTTITGSTGTPDPSDDAFRLITFEDYLDTIRINGILLFSGADSAGSAIYAPPLLGGSPVLVEDTRIAGHSSPAPVFNASTMGFRNCLLQNNVNVDGNAVGILNLGNLLLRDVTFRQTVMSPDPEDRYIMNAPGGQLFFRGEISLLRSP